MNDLIKEKLTEYIGFDSGLLFRYVDYLVVFGGAIRDIIADKSIENITDVDILCLPQSRKKIIETVKDNGYKQVDLQRPDLHVMYRSLQYIFEPRTFMKGDKVIQFITPCSTNKNYNGNKMTIERHMKETFYHLLSSVDLITSGVFYDGYNLFESIKGSVSFIESKKIVELKENLMYDRNRAYNRIYKLEKKGYHNLNKLGSDSVKVDRLLKLNRIKSNYPTIAYFKNGVEFGVIEETIRPEKAANVNEIDDLFDNN